jgi:hypothetical protein
MRCPQQRALFRDRYPAMDLQATISMLFSVVNVITEIVNYLCLFAFFLAYFPYFEKMKEGLCDHFAVCVSPFHHPFESWNPYL